MKLRGLHIDGFGKLSDRAYRFDAPVTIVYGPNEAGKSTMMSFIRSMLFGFASKGNPAERLAPVNGGRHGGRLFFENADGVGYVLERFGEVSSRISVRIEQNEDVHSASSGATLAAEVLTQQQWERMFLGGVNERLFRELYAITLTELQAIGMLEGDELGKQLYHTGWNGGGAIAKTEKLLTAQQDSLYRPRGSTQQMNKLVKSLEETEAQLRQLEDGIAAYNALSEELAGAEAELDQIDHQLPMLREREQLLARACELWEIWVERLALLHEQAAMGTSMPRLAADARSRWEVIAADLYRLKQELEQSSALVERQQREYNALTVDEELLIRKIEIESLMLSVESMNAARQSLVELIAEAREDIEAVHRLIAQISPEWNEGSVRSFQSGVAEREAIRVFRAALQEREKALSQAEAELRAATVQLKEADVQIVGLDTEREQAPGQGIELLPQTLEALRSVSRQFEEAWHELELAQVRAQAGSVVVGRRRVPDAAYWTASGVMAAGAVLLAAAGRPAAAAAAGALAAALAAPPLLRLAQRQPQAAAAGARAMAAPLGRGGRARRGRAPALAAAAPTAAAVHAQPLAAAQRRVAAALQQLAREAEPLLHGLLAASAAPPQALAAAHSEAAAAAQESPLRGYSGAAEGAAPLLSRLRAAIDARQDELRASASTAERVRELSRRQARLRAQHEAATAAAEHAADAAEAIAVKWRDWLTARALQAELSPEAALETYDLAEQAQLRLQAYDRAASKAARIEQQLADFEQAAFGLSEAFPSVCYRAHGDAAAALRLLQAELDKQNLLERQKSELKRQLADQELLLAQQSKHAQDLDNKQQQWFQAAHAADELEWLDALERSERLAAIENARFKLDAQLTAGLSNVQREQLESWYTNDGTQLERMKTEAGVELSQQEARNVELLEHIGRKRQRMEQLLQNSDRQRLMMEREQATASLEQLIDRYAVLSFSMSMIRRTKRMMEEQRQPAVLREASRLMSIMSGGKYKRIWMHEEKQAISLETEDSRIIESMYLSRGTAEQLYLAMRLALAEEASSSSNALPLILDDPLVNFDYGRLIGSAAVLRELAERRQIILFTCHDHMRDALLSAIPDAAIIELIT
ncbi:AAA family ATPase [Paenibacillus sp. OV219]|uniref:AAA family ATPase n=1 Tax=Paenibacillus sp. OV219 TaxID=1884377 RepID=UPI0008C90020|nr:AAA family ATPase [Paenibacillus sp. OV219]SEM71979.1 AAA domain-containing protein [Paenibacillus sp. OV219]